MKKKAIIFCSLIVMLAGLMVSAQAQVSTQYRVNVPFDFNIGDKSFEAGEYVFKLEGQNKEFLTLETQSGKTKFIQIVSKTNKAVGFSKLVFNRYEDRYFLAQIISPTINATILKAGDEQKLAEKQKSKRATVAMIK